jgi:large subunit ribosomal protein L4
MADAALYNCEGEKIEQISLPDELFEAAPNHALVHQAVVSLGRERRVGSVGSKTRAEMKMTKAKWYRQKGTGHARHGARSAPIFVGGGKAHGPKARKTDGNLPKRMRRQALLAVLSAKRREARVTLLDGLAFEEYSTKRFAEILENLEAFGKVLVVVGPAEDEDDKVYRSGRNLPGVTIRTAPHLSLDDLLKADRLILTQQALVKLEEVWKA